MPTDERPGVVAYYWEMQTALRQALDERCRVTGRTLKDELTEAVLHWLEMEPVPSAKARAARLAKPKGAAPGTPKKGRKK
jgi:hypothetical protein